MNYVKFSIAFVKYTCLLKKIDFKRMLQYNNLMKKKLFKYSLFFLISLVSISTFSEISSEMSKIYEYLGIPPNASIEEIKKIRKSWIRKNHPDRFFEIFDKNSPEEKRIHKKYIETDKMFTMIIELQEEVEKRGKESKPVFSIGPDPSKSIWNIGPDPSKSDAPIPIDQPIPVDVDRFLPIDQPIPVDVDRFLPIDQPIPLYPIHKPSKVDYLKSNLIIEHKPKCVQIFL